MRWIRPIIRNLPISAAIASVVSALFLLSMAGNYRGCIDFPYWLLPGPMRSGLGGLEMCYDNSAALPDALIVSLLVLGGILFVIHKMIGDKIPVAENRNWVYRVILVPILTIIIIAAIPFTEIGFIGIL